MLIADVVHDASTRLADAAGEDARLEAEVLLAQALRSDRTHLLARRNEPIDDAARVAFDSLLVRRLAREPLAYILGRREFYGIDIICEKGALIPRPETEMLVEIALAEVRGRNATRIADVGTGSGAIAVAIAASAPTARVTAIDASDAALDIARRNVRLNSVADRVELRRGDLLDGQGAFDIVVANLPYVSADEWASLPPEIREHEPHEALVGGDIGTEVFERLLAIAPMHLAPRGVLAAEMGATQGTRLLAVARARFPDADVCVMKDLAGLDRVLLARTGG